MSRVASDPHIFIVNDTLIRDISRVRDAGYKILVTHCDLNITTSRTPVLPAMLSAYMGVYDCRILSVSDFYDESLLCVPSSQVMLYIVIYNNACVCVCAWLCDGH